MSGLFCTIGTDSGHVFTSFEYLPPLLCLMVAPTQYLLLGLGITLYYIFVFVLHDHQNVSFLWWMVCIVCFVASMTAYPFQLVSPVQCSEINEPVWIIHYNLYRCALLYCGDVQLLWIIVTIIFICICFYFHSVRWIQRAKNKLLEWLHVRVCRSGRATLEGKTSLNLCTVI